MEEFAKACERIGKRMLMQIQYRDRFYHKLQKYKVPSRIANFISWQLPMWVIYKFVDDEDEQDDN